MEFYQFLTDKLNTLESLGNKRRLLNFPNDKGSRSVINLSSNDYLGISSCFELQEQFMDELGRDVALFSSSSSRLLTGNSELFEQLENYLSELFCSSALVFNSGFHMNTGIIPAISTMDTIIFSDELNHASIIDGIRLAKKGKLVKYQHNNINQLAQLIVEYGDSFSTILIVTESIFSMNGDECCLKDLIALKNKYPTKVILYVDEAHAIGVRGAKGLGCAEQYHFIHQIDFLVGTFGKALCSVGGYLICNEVVKEYLINYMRPFIFTTALPPINVAWTIFILKHIESFRKKREHLDKISTLLRCGVENRGYQQLSSSHIVPIVIGDTFRVLQKSNMLIDSGFYILPIRFPTVAKGTERLRISLHANVTEENVYQLLDKL